MHRHYKDDFMEAIIETKQLSHVYSAGTPFERAALNCVDFTAYRGEYLGIIGIPARANPP